MLSGSIVALITPFTKENKIDKKALETLIHWHVENKTDGIVCFGTTGEGWALSQREKLEVLKIALDVSQKKIPIIAGTGTYDTKKTYGLTKKAYDMGADAALVVVPYYNRPSQEGIFYHFKEISKIGIPIILYHHPGRTGVWVKKETFERLSNLKNIIAIKEASGDKAFIKDLIQLKKFPVFSGDDILTEFVLRQGGVGNISIIANIIPKIWKNFICKRENMTEMLKELCSIMVLETNPQCVKYALSLMKKCMFKTRLPLVIPQEKNQKIIEKTLKKYSII